MMPDSIETMGTFVAICGRSVFPKGFNFFCVSLPMKSKGVRPPTWEETLRTVKVIFRHFGVDRKELSVSSEHLEQMYLENQAREPWQKCLWVVWTPEEGWDTTHDEVTAVIREYWKMAQEADMFFPENRRSYSIQVNDTRVVIRLDESNEITVELIRREE